MSEKISHGGVAQGSPTLEQVDAACRNMVAGWDAMDDRDRHGWRSEAKQWAHAFGLYAAQPPAAPKGWRLVPVELTDAMRWAGGSALHDEDEDTEGIWRAILKEAPQPPAAPVDISTLTPNATTVAALQEAEQSRSSAETGEATTGPASSGTSTPVQPPRE